MNTDLVGKLSFTIPKARHEKVTLREFVPERDSLRFICDESLPDLPAINVPVNSPFSRVLSVSIWKAPSEAWLVLVN